MSGLSSVLNKHHALAVSWLLCQGFSYVPIGLSNTGVSTYRKGLLTVRMDNRGYMFNGCDRDEVWEDGGLKYFKERVTAELLSEGVSCKRPDELCTECGQVKTHQNHWAPFGWHDFVSSESDQ